MTPNEAMKVMGLNAGASQEELKKRFHTLAKVHHPDKGGNAETFKKISQANDVLKRGIPAGNTRTGYGGWQTSNRGFGDFNGEGPTSWDWDTGEPIFDPPVTKKPPVRTTYTPPNPGNFRKTANQRMEEMRRHAQMQAEMQKKKAEFDNQLKKILKAQEEMMRRWRGY